MSGLLFDTTPVAEFASAARDCGYTAVELRGTQEQLPPDASEKTIDQLTELFDGLEIANIASHAGNFALLDAGTAAEVRKVALRYFKWAARLGALSVRIWPGWIAASEADPEHWNRAARHLRWCADAAADCGVKVAIEMHHGTLAESASGANRLLDAVDHSAVGLILDPANMMQTPAPFGARSIVPVLERLLHVHVKDQALVAAGDPTAYTYRSYRQHIGKWIDRIEMPRRRLGPVWFAKRALNNGHIPWPAILSELRRCGYAGYLIVESEVGPGMPVGRKLAEREFMTLTEWINAL